MWSLLENPRGLQNPEGLQRASSSVSKLARGEPATCENTKMGACGGLPVGRQFYLFLFMCKFPPLGGEKKRAVRDVFKYAGARAAVETGSRSAG